MPLVTPREMVEFWERELLLPGTDGDLAGTVG